MIRSARSNVKIGTTAPAAATAQDRTPIGAQQHRKHRAGVHIISQRGTGTVTGRMLPFHIEDHPTTKACYFVVMPPRSPVMTEHMAGWKINERPWLKVIDTNVMKSIFPQFRDRRAVFCCWLMLEAPWLPRDRRATVTSLYAEALDDDLSSLMPQHRKWLNTFMASAKIFDGLHGHTPWMAEKLTQLTGLPSAVMPSGFESRVLGEPKWDAPKRWDAAWYGTMVGKRARLIAHIHRTLGNRFADLTGKMSGQLVDQLQFSKTVLYLCHSDVRSYSTWRTWHSISSSAAIVTEPGDYWPLDPSLCIEIPRISDANIEDTARMLVDLDPAKALEIAKAANSKLREFTVSRVIDEYLVKSTEAWLR